MGQAQINVRTRACSGTFIARTKQAALTHNVRGKRLKDTLNMRNEPFYFGVCVRSLCSKVELRNLARHWSSSLKFEYAVIKLLIRCYRASTT